MKFLLKEERVEPLGAPDLPEFRLFDYFTSAIHTSVKDGILKAFVQPTSPLRIVIATIAFSMGVDTPNIRYVVHWGPPEDIEQYVQATGRAGRDGKVSHAVMLFNKGLKKHVDESMAKYCENLTTCVAEKHYLIILILIHVLPELKGVCVVIYAALAVFVVTVNINNCLCNFIITIILQVILSTEHSSISVHHPLTKMTWGCW